MRAPVIIIGAGRSGTNVLRDALCKVDDLHTWPCDELNYLWRYGNRDHPTDELTVDQASPNVAFAIRQAFAKRARRQPGGRVVEKTCANSLRVEFVDALFPEAQFIHLVRDGRDVVASAIERWTAGLDVRYLARKARFVPRRDVAHYASRYVHDRLARRRSDDRRLGWWGPRFTGMERFGPDDPLAEVAAHQWAACATVAQAQLARLDPRRVQIVRYRDLALRPAETFELLGDFLGLSTSASERRSAAGEVHQESVDSWQHRLSPVDKELVSPIVAPVHTLLGLEG